MRFPARRVLPIDPPEQPVRTRSKFLTLAAALVGLLLVPATAFAYAPTGDDFITCVAGGDREVECTAGIFDPGTDVDVEVDVDGTQVLNTTLTADEDGEISFTFDVPEDAEGDVTVDLEGTKNGETFVLSDVIAQADETEVIANAGSDASLLAMGAVGAIALGGAALLVTRRKGAASAA